MAKEEMELYLDLHMEESDTFHSDVEENTTPEKTQKGNPRHAKMAKLYEDAAEYEEDLRIFENELEIVNNNILKDIASELIKAFPEEDKERDYTQELNTIVTMGWTHAVEVNKTHPQEQLMLVKETDFSNIVEKLSTTYPNYKGDFEKEVRALLVKRWENLISIKKDHIKEEHAEIKTAGLKPSYVKRAYHQYHGIIK